MQECKIVSSIQIRFFRSFQTLLKLYFVGEKDIFVSYSLKMKQSNVCWGLVFV